MKESGEMYLETILILSREKDYVRAIDVVDKMNYSKPSVSRALSILRESNYVTVAKDGNITLTDKGRQVAELIYERHKVLSSLLESIGVSAETASADACKIEHDISDESFKAIKAYIAGQKK